MHRRARHLTGRAAGASYHYDARWLSLSDGAGVQTLTDLAGSNNATQSTSANRPTFKTNILNGNPILRFDGVNDQFSLTSTVAIAGEYSAITLFKTSGTFLTASRIDGEVPYTNLYTNGYLYTCAVNRFWSAALSASSFSIITTYTNGSDAGSPVYQSYQNSAQLSTTNGSYTISGSMNGIGYRPSDGLRANGDLAAMIHIPGTMASFLRKRFEHAMGFSYKIACS